MYFICTRYQRPWNPPFYAVYKVFQLLKSGLCCMVRSGVALADETKEIS